MSDDKWCPLCPTNSYHQPHNCPIHTATIVPMSDDATEAWAAHKEADRG